MGRSRMLIILIVLCSGLVGGPAATIILEPPIELSQQPWRAKSGAPQPKSTHAQALPDTWPDPCRGCPQAGPHVDPRRHLSRLGRPASG
jgi:hypothetical protein